MHIFINTCNAPASRCLPGASWQSWDVCCVGVGTLPGLLHPSKGYRQPASHQATGAPVWLHATRCHLGHLWFLCSLEDFSPWSNLGAGSEQGGGEEGKALLCPIPSYREQKMLSICAGLSGVQGLLLTLTAVAVVIRCSSPDQWDIEAEKSKPLDSSEVIKWPVGQFGEVKAWAKSCKHVHLRFWW